MKKRLFKILGVAAIAFLMACLVLVLFLYLLDKDSKEYIEQVENHYFVDGKELTEEEYENYLEEKGKLKGNEIAAIYAVQQLKEHLKNPHSMNLFSIEYLCLSIDYGVADFIVKIEYSSENNVGGTIEDIQYYEFKAAMYNYSEQSKDLIELESDSCGFILDIMIDYYEKDFKEKGNAVNIEKVLNNIDIDVTELTKLSS